MGVGVVYLQWHDSDDYCSIHRAIAGNPPALTDQRRVVDLNEEAMTMINY